MLIGDLTGTQLAGRYSILKQLGVGGSGRVFLARDLRHARDVAVKVLRPEIAAAIGVERFLREIGILAQLEHPGILPLYDSGEAEGIPFFVTPYVGERSLRDRLSQEKFLPLEEAVRIVHEVAEALDFAHGHGIIHRDVKPENVLLYPEHVVLADFGIARAIDVAAGQQLTDSQFAIGTPAYMSPEQSVGGSHLDARSDVYSLGVLAYEMVAGAVPFNGPTPQAIQARKAVDPVPSLRTVRAAVGRGMEAAIKRALAVVPADRFESAGAFSRALAAREAPHPARVGRYLFFTALVMLFGMAVLLTWRRVRPSPPARPPSRVVVAEFENLSGNPALDNLGITAVDWLTEGLQRTGVIAGVSTESAISASRFVRTGQAGSGQDPILELAREAGADIVVSGRIYRSRDSLQYQIQVTDARARRLIGAIGPIGTPLADPIGGLAIASTRLMGLLAAHVDERLEDFVNLLPHPPTYEAYRQFSLGVDRYVQGDFAAAAPLFSAARASDTTFATPLLFASISLSNLGRFREADSLLDRLAAVRDQLSRFHQVWLDYRRAFLAGKRPAALAAVRALDSLAPGSKATYNHAVEALENGYVEESVATLRSLSPNRGTMRGWIPYFEVLGAGYHLLGRFPDELSAGEEARRRYPTRLYASIPSVSALAALGRIEELERLLAEAAALPADPYGTSLAGLLIEAGDELRFHWRDARAAGYYRRALAQLGDSGAARSQPQPLWLQGQAEAGLREWQRVERTGRRLIQLNSGEPQYLGLLGTALAQQGKTAEAREMLAALGRDQRPYLFGGPALAQARIAATLGDLDAAVSQLGQAFVQGRNFDLWIHRDVALDPLRALPQFKTLVAIKR